MDKSLRLICRIVTSFPAISGATRESTRHKRRISRSLRWQIDRQGDSQSHVNGSRSSTYRNEFDTEIYNGSSGRYNPYSLAKASLSLNLQRRPHASPKLQQQESINHSLYLTQQERLFGLQWQQHPRHPQYISPSWPK